MTKPRKTLRFPGVARWSAALCAVAALLPARAPATTAPPDRRAAAPVRTEDCDRGMAVAAQQNRQGMTELPFAPFRRPELGWAVYAPLAAHEIGTRCEAGSAGFASQLAAWQAGHGLRSSGVMDDATFAVMKARWQSRRPFVAANRHGCPPAPPETSLAVVPAAQSYGGKSLLLRPAALAAYRQMLAAARAEVPALAANLALMTVFSAYRSPQYDAARCARDGNCQGIVRAACSAHRTGLALDLYLGAAPGYAPDSSDDANRLYIARGAAYRWMVENAARFGFAPYAFEPWHWEWTGEPV